MEEEVEDLGVRKERERGREESLGGRKERDEVWGKGPKGKEGKGRRGREADGREGKEGRKGGRERSSPLTGPNRVKNGSSSPYK